MVFFSATLLLSNLNVHTSCACMYVLLQGTNIDNTDLHVPVCMCGRVYGVVSVEVCGVCVYTPFQKLYELWPVCQCIHEEGDGVGTVAMGEFT